MKKLVGVMTSLIIAGSVVFAGGAQKTESLEGAEVVAALFPGSSENSYLDVVAPILKKSTGVELIVVPALATEQLGKTKAAAGGKPPFDTLLLSPGQTAQAKEMGLIQKVNPELIPNWSELETDAYRDIWGPAVGMQIDGIAYNPSKIDPPKGYADLFSPKYYGKVAYAGFESNSAVIAWVEIAKALGGSVDNMEPLWEKLAENIDNVGAIANNMNHAKSLFQQGEVDVIIASTGNVAQLKALGVDIEFVHPETGALAIPMNLHITTGSQNVEAAHAYINAAISSEAQDGLQKHKAQNIPVNKNVILIPEIEQYVTKEDMANFVYPDWEKINENRAEWIKRFNEVVKK